MEHTETPEDLCAALVHPNGDGEGVLTNRVPQEVTGRLIELELVGNEIELSLSHRERVEGLCRHAESPAPTDLKAQSVLALR
jgi:hypothetical protein